ncbi:MULTISPECIES: hypothetical protein [unclassified Saccharicrinis]|uniref:hypothetical protein n=1 Tax=unclassified Saccharicrinis TaxID=2646859 RepID=UPI003D348CF5
MFIKLSDVNMPEYRFEMMVDVVVRMFGNVEKDKIDSIISTGKQDIVNVLSIGFPSGKLFFI